MATNARLEELKRKFDENPRRYFAPLANEYRKQGDLTQAITLCRAHLPNQPGHISGHIVLAQALYEAQELPESRQIFEQALELDPENLIALRSLGDIAKAQDDTVAARAWYSRVLDADPRNDEIAAMLRELAADAAARPATPASSPAETEVAPSAEPKAAEPPAREEPAWDPDKTPVANVAIPAAPAVETFQPFVAETVEESEDVFGNGVEDQGAELLDSYNNAAGALPFFEVQPQVEEQSPPDAPAQPAMLELAEAQSSAEFVVEEPAAATSEPAEPEPEEAFVADMSAFTVAQTLSDPEALPEPSTDDWFNAPTPPRGVARSAEDAQGVEPEAPEPETLTIPTPATGTAPVSTSVDIGTFDLIEAHGTPVSHPGEDRDAAVAHAAGWFEPQTADVEAEADESSATWIDAPADELAGAREPQDVQLSAASEDVDFYAPPNVELEQEPTPDAIDTGSVGTVDVFESEEAVAYVATPEQARDVDQAATETPAVNVAAAASEPPPMFVTETMAELYLQQGFIDEALGIYRKLLAQQPDDEGLQSRIAAIESGARSTLEAAAGAAHTIDRLGQSVRTFFGRVASRRPSRRRPVESALDVSSLGAQVAHRQADLETGSVPADTHPAPTLSQLFASEESDPSDDVAAASLAAAFTPDSVGRPTRAADSELSLDHLFRDVPQEQSGAVTLDAFFAAPGGETSASSAMESAPDERMGDIEQFTAWLEGLKKK